MKHSAETLLIAAHPGHEVSIWGWLARSKPRALIVTDGSGGSGQPRIARTASNLKSAEIPIASIFGDYSDRQLYHYALTKNKYFFEMLVHLMANEMTTHRVRRVIGDASEGVIMAHDLLREVRRVAVRIAEAELGWKIEHLEVSIDAAPSTFPQAVKGREIIHELSDDEWRAKILIAKRYRQLRPFVDAAFERYGIDAFQREVFFPCTDQSLIPPDKKLSYEDHGEKMVSQMKYKEVIRFQDHLAPIIRHIHQLQPAGSDLGLPATYSQKTECANEHALCESRYAPTVART